MATDSLNDRAWRLMTELVKNAVQNTGDDEAAAQAAQEAVEDLDLWAATCAALAVITSKVLAERGLRVEALSDYARLGASITDPTASDMLLRSLDLLHAFVTQDDRADDILNAAIATRLSRFALLGGMVNLAGDAYRMPSR